ncbi:MAG: Type IV fimbrial assembly, ATPase PilB [Candidatus Ozemobacter sibiricus]|jgi:type IV pilus assembly protein PilB|uniref:Type IV fimbrial assembly, ATPase PilB n=1 Tax=Candidatus Ozemobacter sibiricus TaxID=2268124 RepID=A0A367ZTL2_9BACT|nr:MAG: Type IV fimbrial assembly, ATPase PilB [Candidatus Ozemobacter sibiricus]
MSRIEKKLLGESLVAENLITPEQLRTALAEQKQTSDTLGYTLLRLNYLTEQQLLDFLGSKLGFPYANLRNYVIDPKVVKVIPENIARKYHCIAMLKVKGALTVAMVDPLDSFLLENLEYTTACKIKPLVSTMTEIQHAIDEFYGAGAGGPGSGGMPLGGAQSGVTAAGLSDPKAAVSLQEFAKKVQGVGSGAKDASVIDLSKMNATDQANIIQLVNLIIMRAIKEKASDIHIEPDDTVMRCRFRIDGMLQEVLALPKTFEAATVSRCKVMAELDIAEKRVPQDGRIKLNVDNREIDLRVSTYPTLRGEKVVMRILDKQRVLFGLEDLGLPDDTLQRYSSLLEKPNGIILVTGPTGSGKTSTLYASLQKIKDPTINIVTIEDPVEYQLPGINQGQINPKAGFTFAGGLRSILRQDPDVIMVGEIRDYDTAEVAIRAALTGHLVFSTLHTNDSAGTVTRLIDMGVEPFLVASSVIGIMAQRLVRLICVECREEFVPSTAIIKSSKLLYQAGKTKVYRGKGCEKCNNTGYRGRTTISELLIMNERIKELIVEKAPASVIKNEAIKQGMRTLRQDGLAKVLRGQTTLEEVVRVSAEDEI